MATEPRDVAPSSATLAVFTGGDGTLLFVPDLCLPPLEAQHAHGPLAFRGRIDVDAARSPLWRDLLLQIDRHLFATVGLGDVALLLGPDVASLCAGADEPPR